MISDGGLYGIDGLLMMGGDVVEFLQSLVVAGHSSVG